MPSILIVEDNEMIRVSIELLMDKEGMLVATANNGAEAFRLLDSIQFDMVITDMMMPEVNGIELIKYIKAHEKIEHMAIIVVSSSGAERLVNEALNLGADDYILKPFRPFDLTMRIKKVLKEKGIFE